MYRHCINGKFHTFIIHLADICCDDGRIVGSWNYIDSIQQVFRMALVIIDRTVNAIIKETVIQTDIISFGSLPLDIRVITVRTIGIIPFVSELITRFRIRYRKGSHIRIVIQNILLSGLTVAQTQFQVWQHFRVAQECFLTDFPSQRYGRE